MKKLRVGWFSFSCCEDSTIIFTELLNDHWQEWKDKIEFVDALVLDTSIPEVPPNPAFRKLMGKKSVAQLFALLQKKDPVRATSIDKHNPRRLIRALEIIHTTGRPVPLHQNNNVTM